MKRRLPPAEPAASPASPLALRRVRMRRGLFLALPPAASSALVPYRLDVLSLGAPPHLLPVQRRTHHGRDAVLLDASGLLPLTRRFPKRSWIQRAIQSSADRCRDRAEAEAVLAKVDEVLEEASDQLLPASCIDLSPDSVFLRYRELDTSSDSNSAPYPDSPYFLSDQAAPRPFEVLLACLPCRIPEGSLGSRDHLVRWFESSGLVAHESKRNRNVQPAPLAGPELVASPVCEAAHAAVPSIRSALPWLVLAVETLAVVGGLLLSASGVHLMPYLLGTLAVVDAVLLLLPTSPLSLLGKGGATDPSPSPFLHASSTPPASTSRISRENPSPPPLRDTSRAPFHHKRPESGPSDRTERLSTAGQVTKLGILSEHEPGTFEEVEGRRWFVLVDEFTIGRDPGQADLVPDAPGVSRLHARIRRLGDAFTLEDLSARNGTFLDDRRLDPGEERVLPEKCTLRFAAAKFWFRVE